ncbi:MAG TPA: 50S ribosomal protein P1, partial [Candidatus Methanoperedenaceae archaeon]|nr:50S ribosomal protein P1 [Candidatus Methanoperedenaceae archaeon]
MKYVYAALLLHSAGKKVTEEGISAVVKAAGIEVDQVRAKALVAALEGVNIDEAISKAAVAAPVAAAG